MLFALTFVDLRGGRRADRLAPPAQPGRLAVLRRRASASPARRRSTPTRATRSQPPGVEAAAWLHAVDGRAGHRGGRAARCCCSRPAASCRARWRLAGIGGGRGLAPSGPWRSRSTPGRCARSSRSRTRSGSTAAGPVLDPIADFGAVVLLLSVLLAVAGADRALPPRARRRSASSSSGSRCGAALPGRGAAGDGRPAARWSTPTRARWDFVTALLDLLGHRRLPGRRRRWRSCATGSTTSTS